MMNKLKTTLLFFPMLALLFSAQYVAAQTVIPANDASTAAMVELCKNTNDVDAQNFCFGFGEGVYQAYLVSRPNNAKPAVCFPQQAGSRVMVLEDFLRWNQANPQYNRERASKTLIRFFTQVYPCK
jgi:Rap1a immunity proteins